MHRCMCLQVGGIIGGDIQMSDVGRNGGAQAVGMGVHAWSEPAIWPGPSGSANPDLDCSEQVES